MPEPTKQPEKRKYEGLSKQAMLMLALEQILSSGSDTSDIIDVELKNEYKRMTDKEQAHKEGSPK